MTTTPSSSPTTRQTTRNAGHSTVRYYTVLSQISVLLCLTAAATPISAFSPTLRTYHSVPTTSTSLGYATEAIAPTVTLAQSALATLDSFWTTSPYTAAAIACGLKASAADMVAQTKARKNDELWQDELVLEQQQQQEEASDFFVPFFKPQSTTTPSSSTIETTTTIATDYKRNAAFLLYGSLYQGMTQEFVYNHLYPAWFGTATSWDVVLTKVAFDLTCQTTLVTLPVAYLLQACVFGQTPGAALQKYVHDVQHQQLLQKYVALWGPVQCLTFGVVPEAYRVTFIAGVSFFWLIVLSGISSEDAAAATAESGETTKEA